jgi:hypothetical protein
MIIGIMALSVFFLGASVWEGIARIASGDELSEKGYTMATNSFPPNTVVEVTNLENGKTIQALVTSGLESSAFLAAFSRDTAVAMGARSQALIKIRMTKIDDSRVLSRLSEGLSSQGTETANSPEKKQNGASPAVTPKSAITQPGTQGTGIPDTVVPPPRPEGFPQSSASLSAPQHSTDPDTLTRYDLALIPAEERPPVEPSVAWILPPEAEIAPLDPLPFSEDRTPMGSSVQEMVPREHFEDWPFFSVPVITSLEQGKYYLQLGAFGRTELIEAELSRIGKSYPLAIQPGGNPQTPIYRILLGPVTLGESAALLQQFKSLGYKDAFIRQGSK